MRTLILFFGLTVIPALSWAQQPTQPAPQSPPQATGDPVAGKSVYEMFCLTCHGPTGLGDGPGGATLNPKPGNFQVSKLTVDEMRKIIKEGGTAVGRSPNMIAWGTTLSAQDVENVIAYIRQLGKK